jgi:hypothetical protein
MIRSVVHDLPSIDDCNQVTISHYMNFEVGSPLFSQSLISQNLKFGLHSHQINGPTPGFHVAVHYEAILRTFIFRPL